MTRSVTRGIFAGLLAALVLVGVGAAAYRAGAGHDPVVVSSGDGEVVRMVGGWHHGPPFGLFFFLLFAGLILFAVFSRRRHGFGPCGPGWWGPGDGPGPGGGEGRRAMLAEWHRQAHQSTEPPSGPAPSGPAPTGTPPGTPGNR